MEFEQIYTVQVYLGTVEFLLSYRYSFCQGLSVCCTVYNVTQILCIQWKNIRQHQ
jgi:hypothetical protein